MHNEQQLQAINTLEGAVLVLAGAGSGKTRVITERIAKVLREREVKPWQILAVTFTNKAAREMVERIKTLVGADYYFPWVNTFHSLCFRLLKRHSSLVNLQPDFMVVDSRDQKKLLSLALENLKLDKKSYANLYVEGIEAWKNLGLGAEDLETRKHPKLDGVKLPIPFGKVYLAYQQLLTEHSACDFGDLIVICTKLFRENPEIRLHYQHQFKYIMVDEYQDVNRAQYQWLRILVGDEPNLCCVGDEDQAIYSWRGADITRILSFQRDFPESKVIRLEDNYRSTEEILEVANSIIKKNRIRLGKKLRSVKGRGNKVVVAPVTTDRDEATLVLSCIQELVRRGHSLKDMAVMMRTGSQMALFEEALLQARLPYRVIGSLKFYDRQEVRDAIAYLQLIQSPEAKLAFKRIVNVPKRGIGKVALEKLETRAQLNQTSLEEAALSLVEEGLFSKKVSASLLQLVENLQNWRKLTSAPSEVMEKVLVESDYLTSLRESKDPAAKLRIENLNELCNVLNNFQSLAVFLEHAVLVTEHDTTKSNDFLNLVTLHSAKGLEFETVFLTGWEEDLFPHKLCTEQAAGLEEERRLAYVGVTRAKQNCFISYCQRRYLFGRQVYSNPSRFLNSLPAAQTCTVGEFFLNLISKQA